MPGSSDTVNDATFNFKYANIINYRQIIDAAGYEQTDMFHCFSFSLNMFKNTASLNKSHSHDEKVKKVLGTLSDTNII